MNKKIRTTIIIIVILPLFVWGGSLLKCEILTCQHWREFDTLQKSNSMFGEIDYLKVLSYSDENARVYYVSKNRSGGDILKFIKEDGKWIYEEWEKTVWSSTGSASEVIWPYWWHFIYGGF